MYYKFPQIINIVDQSVTHEKQLFSWSRTIEHGDLSPVHLPGIK